MEEEYFNFSVALERIKSGYKVARKGWNGKGMFVFLVEGSTFTVNRKPLLGIYPEGTEINYHAHVDRWYYCSVVSLSNGPISHGLDNTRIVGS